MLIARVEAEANGSARALEEPLRGDGDEEHGARTAAQPLRDVEHTLLQDVAINVAILPAAVRRLAAEEHAAVLRGEGKGARHGLRGRGRGEELGTASGGRSCRGSVRSSIGLG